LKERWIVALAVFYYVLLLGGALFVGLSVLRTFENSVSQPFPSYSPYPHNGPLPTPGGTVSVTNITVTHQDDPRYQGAYKPYVITTNMTAQDYHSSNGTSYLHITGWVNNTGDGTAYDASLLVAAMNNEGKVSTSHSFGGVTPHQALGLEVSLPYNGSAIINCTITPYYLDLVDAQNRPRP
jgi:hypothetical protein